MTPKETETPSPEEDNGLDPDETPWGVPAAVLPNYDLIQTEDGKPVENALIEKQMRLLTEALYASWPGPGGERTFQVYSNVGLFYAAHKSGLCPDVMLSLDVPVNIDLSQKENRSYFIWEIGKAPEVVIEIISDRRGGEASFKMGEYALIGIPCYVLFDPAEHLKGGVLRAFRLLGRDYQPIEPDWFPEVCLGLTLWQGNYENQEALWLRWCDQQGQVIPTGRERAEQERQRAEQERQRADRLAAKLRELGIDPNA
jgi:Uma2 family endonuclease